MQAPRVAALFATEVAVPARLPRTQWVALA